MNFISKNVFIIWILLTLGIATQSFNPKYRVHKRTAGSESESSSVETAIDTKSNPSKSKWQQFDFSSPDESVTLKSSNYPESYDENEEFNIVFNCPTDSFLQISCENINIEDVAPGTCSKDFVLISLTGTTDYEHGFKICGRESHVNKTSNKNKLAFSFVSGERVSKSNKYNFQCVVSMVLPSKAAEEPTSSNSTAVAEVEANSSLTDTSVIDSSDDNNIQTNSPSDLKCDCGYKNEATRIVNGESTSKNEIPWRCYLFTKSMGPFCDSTIIDKYWVMTAAHCTVPLAAIHDDLYVICGDHDVYNKTETEHKTVKVKTIIQHPDYDTDSQDNDITLLELSEPMPWSRIISPACLPWRGEGNSCETPINVMASGWGATYSGGLPSRVLRKVELPCMSSKSCSEYYSDGMITDNMICTYTPGKDACQGDSGGSIDHKDPDTSRYTAIGIVSWGVGCATPNKPGVFTNVAHYVSWIKEEATGAQFCGM